MSGKEMRQATDKFLTDKNVMRLVMLSLLGITGWMADIAYDTQKLQAKTIETNARAIAILQDNYVRVSDLEKIRTEMSQMELRIISAINER